MPIIIKPTKAGMQDIDRSTFKQSGYDVDKKLKPKAPQPSPRVKPSPQPKPMSKEGSMDNMREYMDIFDSIEESDTAWSTGDPVMYKGKEIDLRKLDYDMQDISDGIYELNAPVMYTDGTEVADGDYDDLYDLPALNDYIYQDYTSESVEEESKETIETEEDCGCDQEAIDAMVSVPVQELQDILQLAGYENYSEKIAEYANEPEEEYGSVEDQMIGLSGGLNGPKKMYPASADGDNPMNQEPREIEENTMEAVEEKLYKSYKDFLEEAETTDKD